MFQRLVYHKVLFPFDSIFCEMFVMLQFAVLLNLRELLYTCSGFNGGKNDTPTNVRYTGSVTIGASSPDWTFTIYECMDAVFAFSYRFTSSSIL